MSIFEGFMTTLGLRPPAGADTLQPGESHLATTERGRAATPEDAVNRIHQMFFTDFRLRAKILEIRRMDELDPRVKKIHSRSARAAAKGGLRLKAAGDQDRLQSAWENFERRLFLHRREKLESDMRGLMMEGNLPMQWVIDTATPRVVGAVRMPSETIVPVVGPTGRFIDPRGAYEQRDILEGKALATFALWQLTVVRLNPQNYDDFGSLGRPYLDATRTIWKKLDMTEEDLVVRRRTRAAQRMVHVLEGAPKEEVAVYRDGVEQDQAEGNWRDYYLNRKGGVTPVGGDANLDQIADVAHLLDTFFAGAPAPKGLFGYADDLSRDILEDLKRDYYDELDSLQDVASFAYEAGFRLDLLLQGINPDQFDFEVCFAERHTETLNQRADRALKYQAMSVPRAMIWDAAGLDPAKVRAQREAEARDEDPYPDDVARGPRGGSRPNGQGGPPRVSITPGNERQGDSGTSITN